jgi:hypothetical protein
MNPTERLTPPDPIDLASALAFALRFHGRKLVHSADEIMAEIVAKRLVEHLERAGFVVMKRPPIGGGAALGRGLTVDRVRRALPDSRITSPTVWGSQRRNR